MSTQFQYTRLAYQAHAVDSVFQVFADVRFVEPTDVHANPIYLPHEAQTTLRANIERIRAENGITAGSMEVPHTPSPALSLDVLMETGTGKTFTFIETIHRLHQKFRLAKFIVLVPSNAIRHGTIKTLQTTAAFFAKEYSNQKINVFNYSDKTVKGFIHGSNTGISVMVATYQSFAGDTKIINKRGVEANLFGHAKSYMDALETIRPVLIIDEPHRFDGKVVREYLPKFNPILTLRFGATFKRDEYRNLVYALDSLEAFRQRLVKGITVDTVGAGADMNQVLLLQQVTGSAKERTAHLSYQTSAGKTATAELRAKDNLGEKTGLGYLDGHVVERVTIKELLFTNGFSLPIGEPTGYGMLAEEVQSLLVQRAISNHFEREEALFKRGIKAISLYFIDAVYKYLPDGKRPAVLRETFERHYREQLAAVLSKDDLDPAYRAYLERTSAEVDKVHKGYFARSHSEKGEEEAIRLILQEKEKLLSFDTDLRFIFSMWALQEGWDNPNVFTLCKLAPSDSKISKLQQIGRGLRLAVNQQLERVHLDDEAFDEINDLMVVVPASEGDFVHAIQSEITDHSLRRVSGQLTHDVLRLNGVLVGDNAFMTVTLLNLLAGQGIVLVDMITGVATLTLDKVTYQARRNALEKLLTAQVPGFQPAQARNLIIYLDAWYEGAVQIKARKDKQTPYLKIRPEQYKKFKHLWENINRRAVIRYELDGDVFKEHALRRIAKDFKVLPLSIAVTRTTDVETVDLAHSTQQPYIMAPQSIYTLGQFVRELANQTRLSIHTVLDILRRMPADKFKQIKDNENRALVILRDLLQRCIHELIINKMSYALREIRIQTTLTDTAGQLLKQIPLSQCGKEAHDISNSSVRDRSLFDASTTGVDSQIERDTVDESNQQRILVFAKLPKINIPTPVGNYNPDFGYVIASDGQAQSLYLVVETKGYDSYSEIPDNERMKIDSAKRFFAALKDRGVNVHYQTKVNYETLAQLIQQIDHHHL